MVRKSRIALGVAIVLGTASAATAATKHPVRHHRVAVESANSYGSVNAGRCRTARSRTISRSRAKIFTSNIELLAAGCGRDPAAS